MHLCSPGPALSKRGRHSIHTQPLNPGIQAVQRGCSGGTQRLKAEKKTKNGLRTLSRGSPETAGTRREKDALYKTLRSAKSESEVARPIPASVVGLVPEALARFGTARGHAPSGRSGPAPARLRSFRASLIEQRRPRGRASGRAGSGWRRRPGSPRRCRRRQLVARSRPSARRLPLSPRPGARLTAAAGGGGARVRDGTRGAGGRGVRAGCCWGAAGSGIGDRRGPRTA